MTAEMQELAFRVARQLLAGLREGGEALQKAIGLHKFFLREKWSEVLVEAIKGAESRDEISMLVRAVWQKLPGLEVKQIRQLLGLSPEEFIGLWPERLKPSLQLLKEIESGSRENKGFILLTRKIWQKNIPGLLKTKRKLVELNVKDLIGFLPSPLAFTCDEYLALETMESVAEPEIVTWIFDILSQMKPKKRWGDEERARFFLDKVLKRLLELEERNKLVEREDRLSPKSMDVLNNLLEDIEKLKQWFGKKRLRDWIISNRSGLHILYEGIRSPLLREYVVQAIELFNYFQVIATQTGCLTFFYYDPLLLSVARAKADEELSRVKNF